MLKPIGDKVVILPIDQEEKSAGGIVIPDAAKEKPFRGVVLASGNENLKEQDIVYYGKTHGTEIEHEGLKHLVIDADLLLAIEVNTNAGS